MKRLLFAISAIIVLAFTGCENGSDDGSETKATLSVSPDVSEIEFSADGEKAYSNNNEIIPVFTVTTNRADWDVQISPKADWCNVSKSGNTFEISVRENTTNPSTVITTAIVTASNATPITIPIRQNGYEAPDVYILGSERLPTGTVFKWWNNSTATAINILGTTIQAGDMVVNDGDVYVAGHQKSGNAWYACYWVNGEKKSLSVSNSYATYASAISLFGQEVYVVGQAVVDSPDPQAVTRTTTGVYWKNGVSHRVSETDNDIDLRGIAAKDNDV